MTTHKDPQSEGIWQIYSLMGMDLVRAINMEMIRYKMLWKQDHNKIKIILSSVITSRGGGQVSLASTTWAELAGVPDQHESAAELPRTFSQKAN